MKHARKIASLLLALVMVFSMAVTTSFAAGTGSITVDNPVSGQTYTAYKIFDVQYNGDKYSYTINSGDAWFTTVQTYAATESKGLKLTQVNGSSKYVVTTTAGFSAPDFAAALKAAVSGKTGTELTGDASSVTADNLPLGYYFVTSSTGALCNLTTTKPSVTIHDKNDVPFKKTADKTNADVGETVKYTITGKVPDTTGFTSYTYKISDTMTAGLTFADDVEVYVDGTLISADKYTYAKNGNGFDLTIDVMNLQTSVGKEIKVTYTAVVNENAVAKIDKNSATLEYSNDPSNSSTTETTTPADVKIYSSKIVIDKYESGSEATKLEGAEFVLYKKDGDNKSYYKWNEEAKKVEWVSDESNATVVTTNSNGAASFEGLSDGTYYLEETKAPEGYNLLTTSVSVSVAGGATEESLSVTAKVANSTGALLPSTGGIGTTIFYIIGSLMVVGAAVLLIAKKRMSRVDN